MLLIAVFTHPPAGEMSITRQLQILKAQQEEANH